MGNNIYNQKGCVFCERKNFFVLFENEHFFVVLDNFPLIEGHLLIFSKNHYGCGGELPENHLKVLGDLKNKVSNLLRTVYGVVHFYEHGRAGHCVSFGKDEALCHHFHLHALPLSVDIADKLNNRFQKVIMPSYTMIDSFFARFGEYLFYENDKQEAMFYPIAEKIEQHLLRTIIARAIDFPERADWQNVVDHQFVQSAQNNAQLKLKV